MTMQFEPNQLAAAELADRYIEIVLSTKPEQLLPYQVTSSNEAYEYAKVLTDFRQQLINGFLNQPLPGAEDV